MYTLSLGDGRLPRKGVTAEDTEEEEMETKIIPSNAAAK